MKSINDYLAESLYYDDDRPSRKDSSKIVKNIKNAIRSKFGNDVILSSGKSNHMMIYDIYCYKVSFDIIKGLDAILTKYLSPKYESMSDSEIKDVVKSAEEYLEKHKDTRAPYEFVRFDSRGIQNLDNPNYAYNIVWNKNS